MMVVELKQSFLRQLKKIVKRFPKSEKRIRQEIDELGNSPEKGKLYPGYGGLDVRKFRIDLPEYRISGKKALRLIHICIPLRYGACKRAVCVFMRRGRGLSSGSAFGQ